MKTRLFFIAAFLLTISLRSQPAFSWAGRIGGTSNDGVRSITADPSGNIIITGHFKGTADLDLTPNLSYLTSNSSSQDVYFCKYTPTGSLIWARQLSGMDYDGGLSVKADPSGNIFATGYFENTVDFDPGPGVFNLTGSGNGSMFLLKLDASGNFQWAKQFGGVLFTMGCSLSLDPSGNINVGGSFQGTVDFDPGPGTYTLASGSQDQFVAKYDPSGNFLWVKQYGGLLNLIPWMCTDIAGNIFITGDFSGTVDFDPGPGSYNLTSVSGLGARSAYVSKLDPAGNFVWAGVFTSTCSGQSIKVDNSGNVYVTGSFTGNSDFDIGPGTYFLSTPFYDADAFVAKLTSAGNIIWVKQLHGKGGEYGCAIDVDALGNVYTTGMYRDTIDLDPGPATYTFMQLDPAYPDIYVSKLDMNGDFSYGTVIQSIGWELSKDLVVDGSGNLYVTGIFSYPCDFDPGWSNTILTSKGAFDVFVVKFSDPSTGLNSSGSLTGTSLKVYPNPFNNKIILEVKETDRMEFTIYNAMGSVIRTGIIAGQRTEIDLSNEAEGLYFIKTDTGTYKIIKN